ncbi:PIR Superfamily Protein [Plasmodium ovale wallikeri]|uniref:PIR Superfamily Protein n=2 Tax=Plasmodium ovale TaxID=36330 RepID=A0A1A9A7X2_PLAOA|nr:PIR Superfamily Protein [Plasmodium ovale curtisi]SBT52208.1 PIR Superfamily Protein [Plasmodium ovale wallikeri]SBT59328.1 PIR Superfamily Protein [Plasmodium ovale wallikeri]
MSTIRDNFTYEEFENDNHFLRNLLFDKIYKKFNSEYILDPDGEKHCNQIKNGLQIPYSNEDIILNFCKILYIIIAKDNGWHNELYNEIPENYKKFCLHLKYWLYEKVVELGPVDLKIENHFEKWKSKLEIQMRGTLKNICTFNELEWNDINKLRRLYAFALIYYSNIDTFHTQNNIECKYLDFLGKGLKEYHESINRCSGKNEEDNYCKEFKEFQDIYKLGTIYSKKFISDKGFHYVPHSTSNCPLVIESLKDPIHVIYKEENNTLHLSNKPINSLNSTIISASSAIGTTVGIFAFLFYLYKYTSLGFLLRSRMQKDNIILDNVGEGTPSFRLPTSEFEHTPIENSEYTISYYSINNS